MTCLKGTALGVLWIATASILLGCGQGSDEEPDCDKTALDRMPAVLGHVYTDNDASDRSIYDSGYKRQDSYQQDLTVTLIEPDGERTTTTCKDGFFAFGDLDTDLSLISLDLPAEAWATTANLPRRLPEAIREGALTMVTFGDSLPVYGPTPRFPERVADQLRNLAQVTDHNVAVEGTTTDDWMPDTRFYRDRLEPLLADADLILISIGGNDVLYFASDAFNTGQVGDLEEELPAFLDEVLGRIRTILAAIRQVNPDADIAWLAYPNYATSTAWENWLGAIQDFVIELLGNGFEGMRSDIEPADRLLLIDMYGATKGEDLDPLLIDELHFSNAGHARVATEVLKTLGAVRGSWDPVDRERQYGIAP